MATGAAQILENLPPTFAPLPRPTALSALADAFGGELAQAENTLAAVMLAHWVDYADKNADALTDLASIAALYGLAPRDDETIEGFRSRLKRHVRTFLDGTVTVRGICRIVAEALGLVIADDYAQLDTWWRRPDSLLATVEAAGDDAATALFGVAAASVRGSAARPAELSGTVDLTQPVDLRGRSRIEIAVDGGAPVTFDLAQHLNASAAEIGGIVAALNTVAGIVAESHGGSLAIRSASAGAASTLELGDVAGDAVPAILGIAPRLFFGAPATHAQVAGAIDLPNTLDLTQQRYLRITIDGSSSYEVDCAGANASATTPQEIVASINAEVGAAVASLQGRRLALATPMLGFAGTIALRAATAGDAAPLLFGDADTYARGSDAAPARASSNVDLSAGVDLSENCNLTFAIDAGAPTTVNCKGVDPHKTLAGEIATAINSAVGHAVATQNGRTLTLASQTVGPSGQVRFFTAPANDALALIFGLAPRRATGADAAPATFTGDPIPSGAVDLRALRRVQVALDDGAPTIVDVAAAAAKRSAAAPGEIADAINGALGAAVASVNGTRLTLVSAAPGDQGSIAILPIERQIQRLFVSRAFSIDEASNAALGWFARKAQGSDATSGSLEGSADLYDGLDLSKGRFIRLSLDGAAPRDVDCASKSRPYATLLTDLVQAINDAFGGQDVAAVSGSHLVLTSPSAGRASAIVLMPNAGDASQKIFGLEPRAATGQAARRVVFTGLANLSHGVDLSAADRVRLAIDGAAPVEITCSGMNPAHTLASEIVSHINVALGGSYASTDGTYLRLASAQSGSPSTIAFLAPAQGDATRAIFGIGSARTYRGDDARPARLTGAHDLAAHIDLSATPYLRLAIDGQTPVLIDCRGADAANTTPAEIVARIGAAIPSPAGATFDGARVVVTSGSKGAASRVELQAAGDGDAGSVLLGNATVQPGLDATPARLQGAVDLRQPVDMSQRSILRVAVDGARAVDIDLAGAAPDRTFGEEIKAAINAVLPGAADLDDKGRLILSSPTAGAGSSIEVEPLRPIEVIEYPPTPAKFGPQQIQPGKLFTLRNDGAWDARVAFTISSAGGLGGFDVIGLTTGARIHVEAITGDNESVTIAAGQDGGIAATIADADGTSTPIPSDDVVATPEAAVAVVPFDGTRTLATGAPGTRPALALVDPLANNVVILEAISAASARPVGVRVAAADSSAASAPPAAQAGPLDLVGRLRVAASAGELIDGTGATIAPVRATAGIAFAPFDGRIVLARGTWYPAGANSVLAVDTLAQLFDVDIDGVALAAVAIDARAGKHSLAAHLAPGSVRVLARDAAPADMLQLPRGRSDWMVVPCDGSRFDAAFYDTARFAGGTCDVAGIFNVSRFDVKSAGAGPLSRYAPFGGAAAVTVSATWESHLPGAFTVNLPADLPDIFGARFGAARFASPSADSETYNGIVLDPRSDPKCIDRVLTVNPPTSPLVFAQWVANVPLGWEAQTVPFAQPRTRYLSGGRKDRPSALYLQQRGVAGAFGIFARDVGAWGDQIAVSVRYAGPAMFDLSVAHAAARFECARQIAFAGRVLGPGEDPLPALSAQAVKPKPIGVVQAKAAGIRAAVTRERA